MSLPSLASGFTPLAWSADWSQLSYRRLSRLRSCDYDLDNEWAHCLLRSAPILHPFPIVSSDPPTPAPSSARMWNACHRHQGRHAEAL